jgi:glycosyltransferase involved in cell wall biosynthesis
MVVMEAMFAGLPVVVSNTPGMNEVVVDNEVGRIVDFDAGENQLSIILEDLTANRARWQAMGAHARDRAKARYSTQAMSGAIQATYAELLEAGVDAEANA